MWLCDSLPRDLPGAQIMIYGYDTQLHGSISFQDLESIASSFRASIAAQRTPHSTDAKSRTVPLIFIAHSLGGLIVKEAIIQMKNDTKHQDLLESVYGGLFFGVPSQGMEIASLVPMVKDQPNQALLHTLGKESQLLRNQSRDFPKAFDSKDSEIFCYYETEMSRTAKLVCLIHCSYFHILTFTRQRIMYGRWGDRFASWLIARPQDIPAHGRTKPIIA